MVVFAMDADGVGRRLDEVIEVIASSYGGSADAYRSTVCYHMSCEGFRFVGMEDKDSKLFGLAYGHTLVQDHGLHPFAASLMDQSKRDYWLTDAFHVVELAVRPSQQGRGFGVRLLNNLLGPIETKTALLPVRRDGVARRLCERHGWEVLIPEMRAGADGPVFTLMGRDNGDRSTEIWER
jgi:GNAT superfamily N-acetyltransferase